MTEHDIIDSIDELVREERELRSRAEGQGLSEDDGARLTFLEQRLDQCWDLLRQRRARAEFGEDVEQAAPRPVDEVESYRQ
ncbi:hypothetical protein A6411_10510 [Prescottella equi]|uniref:DUF2630 family protein n=1 Tax=Rhodococcus hoagii TaxID=43767 RepID=UPI0009BE79DD|nr:DUF2630 family protein [Prescottella equi]OQQ32231.1 hypothetical protein A6411_10510 [Prescottella equi]